MSSSTILIKLKGGCCSTSKRFAKAESSRPLLLWCEQAHEVESARWNPDEKSDSSRRKILSRRTTNLIVDVNQRSDDRRRELLADGDTPKVRPIPANEIAV